MFHRLLSFLFPEKCLLCRKLLADTETDLCHNCRKNAPVFTKAKNSISFVAGWTAVWYYKDAVRRSMLRYKFYHARSYAPVFGRHLAMKLQASNIDDFDLLTWVPISPLRKIRRGYDQTELLAKAVAKELGVPATRCLAKIRHNPAQSGLKDPARRRANVLGAYKVIAPEMVRDQRILLIDDILTTGATVSECAKALQFAGAKEVLCATLAVTPNEKNHTDM